MASAYLASGELGTYGVPAATTAQITSASALVDAYLKRPEGLQWTPDFNGSPAFMAGLSPTFTLKMTVDIAAGVNVSVPVQYGSGQLSSVGSVGDVVILDKADTNKCEACVIASVSPSAIVLSKVLSPHLAQSTIDFGLVIKEMRTLPKSRAITRVSSWPIVRMLSVLGSYRYGRRATQIANLSGDNDLLAMQQTFGGPPAWMPVDVSAVDFDAASGEIWVPSGILLANYSDVRFSYVAGFSQANIPAIIKSATAAAIIGGVNVSDLAGGLKMARAGDTALERFGNTVLDGDTRAQLDTYRARLVI
jgi:hypothetical protein